MSHRLLPVAAWRAARLRNIGIWLGYLLPWGVTACVMTWRFFGARHSALPGALMVLSLIHI